MKVIHFATLASDIALCGVNIMRGGWSSTVAHVTCKRCLKSVPFKK